MGQANQHGAGHRWELVEQTAERPTVEYLKHRILGGGHRGGACHPVQQCDLAEVVARAGLLLDSDGSLRVSIPSEGTPLWTLGWKLTTGLEFRLRHGLDYGILMRHEHVNSAREIETLLRHFFDDVEDAAFGLSKGLSLYQFYACERPNLQRCAAYLEALGS